jgi:hypothetical protein
MGDRGWLEDGFVTFLMVPSTSIYDGPLRQQSPLAGDGGLRAVVRGEARPIRAISRLGGQSKALQREVMKWGYCAATRRTSHIT